MPYEEAYLEEEFIEDDMPIGEDVTKEMPLTLENPPVCPQKRSR